MAKTVFMLLELASAGAVVYVEHAVGVTYPEEARVIEQYATDEVSDAG